MNCDGDATFDCLGNCNGDAEIDECGLCDGPGIPDGECDCECNIEDCQGVCGGNDFDVLAHVVDVVCSMFENHVSEACFKSSRPI